MRRAGSFEKPPPDLLPAGTPEDVVAGTDAATAEQV